MDNYEILTDMVKKMHEITYDDVAGSNDEIFFEKEDAMIRLNRDFNVDANGESDDNEYLDLKETISNMKYFAAFSYRNTGKVFVDDFSSYLKDLYEQIKETAEFLEMENDRDDFLNYEREIGKRRF